MSSRSLLRPLAALAAVAVAIGLAVTVSPQPRAGATRDAYCAQNWNAQP